MNIPTLTLTKEQKEWGTGIIKQFSTQETYPLHNHDFYEIFFITHGKGLHCINGKEQLLSNGSIVYIRPDDTHSFKAFNYFDFTMFSLGFVHNELMSTLSHLEIPLSKINEPALPIHLVAEGNIKTYLEQQLSMLLASKVGMNRKRLFRVILPQLLYLLTNLDKQLTDEDIIPKWLTILDDQMSVPQNYIEGLPKMLELCHYSQEYMNRTFKKYFKITPTEYINTKRMIYATELLLSRKYEII